MVRTETRTIEVEQDIVVADTVSEDIHFNGETVAIFGEFDEDDHTADIDVFDAALTAIEQGADRVDINDHIAIEHSNGETADHFSIRIAVHFGDGKRISRVGELQNALDQSRDL